MSSDQIVEALLNRHTKDVFVTECKDGPTWSKSHHRMDVWTMNRSWSNPRIVGYEIKVSKSDFLHDTKWQAYLPMCNELYFVCPKGLIKSEEMPGDVGLCYCVGKRIRTVKKSAWRDIQIPDSLARYLLMCRTRIVDPNHYGDENGSHKLDYWRDWLSEKNEKRDIGYRVSRALRDHVLSVEEKCRVLKAENDRFEQVRKAMERLDIPIHGYSWGLDERLEASRRLFSKELLEDVERAAHSLDELHKKMKREIA